MIGPVLLALSAAAILALVWLLHAAGRKMGRLDAERRALRERERHLHAILENMVDAFLLVGPDGRILEVSAGAARLLGRQAADLRGTPCRALVHPEDRDAYDDLFRFMVSSPGQEARRELRFARSNGIRWMEVVATNLLTDPDVGGFLIQAHDVTDHKRAQELVRERESQLRATLNQIPAILWVADRDLRLITVVGAGLKPLGITPDRLIATSVIDFLGQEPAVFRRALDGESGEMESTVRGRTLRTFVEPFRGDGDEVVGILGISFDTTHLNRAQAALLEEGRLHRLLTDHAGDVVASHDRNGRLSYVSPACQAILGYSPEEFRRLADELVHPQDAERVAAAHRRALDGEASRLTYRIRRKDGTYIWFESVLRPVPDGEGRPNGLVVTSREVTEQKRAEEQLLHLAYYDQMTGLPNQVAFEQRLAQALACPQRRHVAIIQINVDNFQVINDSLGHQAGDDALVQISERLRHFRQGAMVARLGGDEFAVLLEDVEDANGAVAAAERLAMRLDAPLHVGGREFQVTFSFGVAIGAAGVSTAKELLRQADVALHYGKRQGKGRCVLYHPSMTANALERLELEAELRKALRENQLQLYYQPIVALKSRTVVGAEALLRWRHPRRGWVSPGEFIPIAEQSGFIIPLGRWVLEQACREARTWQERFRLEAPLSISVNLSAVQVQDSDLADEVADVLESTGLPPEHLTLEITETALMQNPESTQPSLQRLKSLGVQLAMDDFGAGHSSLHYLKQFPLDTLKIDRSFVTGLGLNRVDSALVRTVIGLANALNMGVTAEGVESAEQAAELMDIGCDRAQGYYYALPVPPDQLGPVLDGLNLRAVRGL